MNRRPDEPSDDLTDRLAGSYRAQRESPPPMLDALILAKAKRTAEQRRVARLRALGASFAIAATLVLGLALSLQVITMPAPLATPDERTESVTKESAVAEPVDRLLQQRDALPVRPAPQVVPPPRAAMELKSLGPAPADAAPMAVAAPPAASAPREDPAAARARIAADLRADQAERTAELDRLEVTGARAKRAQYDSIEQRLAEIDRLSAEGRTAEAASLLAEFCRDHPSHLRCAQK